MRIIALTALAFAAFISTASAQPVEMFIFDGRAVVIPHQSSFDHYITMCDKYVHRMDQKKECKVDMEVQKKLWDSFVQARKHASLAVAAKQADEERYGLERARALLQQIRSNEKTIMAAWPEILRPH